MNEQTDIDDIRHNFKALRTDSEKVSAEIARSFQKAFRQIMNDAEDFESVLKKTILNISSSLTSQATRSVTNQLSSGLTNAFTSMIASKNGNIFSQNRLQAFATGGVVSPMGSINQTDIVTQPTLFPLANRQTGLMGEAGAEAIMPLSRDSQGRLGVVASQNPSGQPIMINVNINATDIDSFHRSSSQISRSLSKALRQGLK